MKVKIFNVNPFQMNCYLYYCENTKEGVIVDPGFYTDNEKNSFIDFVAEKGIDIKYTLLTHGHIDHIIGNRFATERYGTEAYLHKGDIFLYENFIIQCENFGLNGEELPRIINYIDENLELSIGKNTINFIHTPGHSPGGICIADHTEKIVFCGDLIFKKSIGRYDLPGGNFDTLIKSIKEKLFALCTSEYTLYPGHMDKTTIKYEKENNEFLV